MSGRVVVVVLGTVFPLGFSSGHQGKVLGDFTADISSRSIVD